MPVVVSDRGPASVTWAAPALSLALLLTLLAGCLRHEPPTLTLADLGQDGGREGKYEVPVRLYADLVVPDVPEAGERDGLGEAPGPGHEALPELPEHCPGG